MRKYGRYLGVLAFIVLSIWISEPYITGYFQNWFQMLENADPRTLDAQATSSLTYPVRRGKTLTFAIPEESQQLRIITNAHIKRADALAANPNWGYTIRYELLDKGGKLLKSGNYQQYSRITSYTNEKGELVYNNYYANQNLVPLDGRVILLSLKGMHDVAYIKVGLEAINPAIIETAIRVYVPLKIAQQRLATEWLRMKPEQRENLAKNIIYPASLLSPSEKMNLVMHQWQPLGPMGVTGTAYQTMTLYTLRDLEMDAAYTLASGLQSDDKHYAVIPLPEGGGEVELSFKDLDGSVLKSTMEVNLQWFGRSLQERWQKTEIWTKDSTGLKFGLNGGLLVIHPALPVIVAASLSSSTETKHDISDALLSIKSYRANFGVDFDILHFQQQSTAIRIDVRRLFDPAQAQGAEKVQYQWLDEENKTVSSGTLTALPTPSLYDRIGMITDGINVSDPVSYYFHVPATVAHIRLIASGPGLLVGLYNQPYGLAKVQRVPEDLYFASSIYKDVRDQQLSWFPLPPSNENQLLEQQAVQWISGQYRPPEDKPDVLAGEYLWQDFIPEGQNAAFYLLTGYIGEEPRADALPSIYCALPVNRNVAVKLAALNGLKTTAPELVYLRDTEKPFRTEVYANQQKILSLNTMGRQGIAHLPELALGRQTVRLQTDGGGQWLMNYQANCTGARYLKRRVYLLKADHPLDFLVQHGAIDEVLTARLYTPFGEKERSQIKVEITPQTGTPAYSEMAVNWTFTHRLYDVRPLAGEPIPLLYSQNQFMGSGEHFAIPINSDLPAGWYRLRVSLAEGAPGMVIVSQVKPGTYEQRRFYREINLEKH